MLSHQLLYYALQYHRRQEVIYLASTVDGKRKTYIPNPLPSSLLLAGVEWLAGIDGPDPSIRIWRHKNVLHFTSTCTSTWLIVLAVRDCYISMGSADNPRISVRVPTYFCAATLVKPPQHAYGKCKLSVSCSVPWDVRDVISSYRYMSQVTWRLLQASRIGNPQMATRQDVNFCARSADRSHGIRGKRNILRGSWHWLLLVTCSC